MKGFFSYTMTLIFLSLFAGFIFWFINPQFFSNSKTALSPLPDFLTLSKNKQVASLDLFLPVLDFLRGDEKKAPVLSAKAAIVFDLTTGKTLYEKNPKQRLPMASLTKVMTAIIGFENMIDGVNYRVTDAALVGEDSMGLQSGEVLTFEELLYGLMLPSGNDASEVIAANYPLGRDAFIQSMNEKARSFGLSNTNFTNPSGLEGDGDQYTTVYDLVVITKYALEQFPLFRTVVQTPSYTIPGTSTHKAFYLENETNLLTTYPGVKGVKTGYTPEAGLCLITFLDYKGHKLIAVLLNSENRRAEMKDLLDYSLQKEGISPPRMTN